MNQNLESDDLYYQTYVLYENEGVDIALDFAQTKYKDDLRLIELIAFFWGQKYEFDKEFYWAKRGIEYGLNESVIFSILAKHYLRFYYKDKDEKDLWKALGFAKKYRDLESDNETWLMIANFNIGFIYFTLKKHRRASVYFRKAMNQGHVYSEMYFIAMMFELEPMLMNPFKLLCMGYRIRMKKLYLMRTNKKDMRLYKGVIEGNQILGDESILRGWIRKFKNRNKDKE